MMKAKRTYKDIVASKEQDAEKLAIESYKKDMEKSKENKYFKEQEKEFGQFLITAVAKDKPFQFLVDMKAKIDDGLILTDNMANALRKCMKREADFEAKKGASEAGTYPSITLKVKPFIMKELGLDSRIITGKVKAESSKAWLIEGHADMLENMSFCVRCARELTEPASQVTGMGVVCAEKAGVPYDTKNVLGASKQERKKIRELFRLKLNQQKFERWIPKSQAEEFKS